jgi:hypothetical protein
MTQISKLPHCLGRVAIGPAELRVPDERYDPVIRRRGKQTRRFTAYRFADSEKASWVYDHILR